VLIGKYNIIKGLIINLVLIFFVSGTSNLLAIPSIEGIQFYQKNASLSPMHKQNIADDIDRYQNADNFWDVLRDEFSLPHYEDNPIVQEKIEWFMNNQGFLLRSATRAAPYLYYISQQVKNRHLPAELVLLPIVESGYNPFSLSHVGAAGIWQLMPGAASDFGVKRNNWYDGRRDVIVSTRGALNYLAYLERFFDGNWLLAIAAYNTGQGNVMAAVRRNAEEGKNIDFWSLPLAQETKDYVPSLLALAVIISHPDQYPIPFPPVQNAPYLAQVDVGKNLNLQYAASLAGISYEKITQLNPGINRRATADRAFSKLVLPIENVMRFTENFANSPDSPSINWPRQPSKSSVVIAKIARKIKSSTMMAANYVLQPGDTIYMVRVKDTIDKIAKRFHVKKDALVSANANKKIAPGKQIIIPTHAAKSVATNPVKPKSTLQAGDTIYMVRRGDTIDSIASRFKTTASVIRLTNLIDDSSLTEGQRIVVPTHLRG
jgi:membrane-bound lytic murein transglycosylase D